MSIPLTGTGGLFTRLGEIGALIYRENIQQNTLHTYFGDLVAQYTSDTDLLSGVTPDEVPFSQIPTAMVQALTTLASNTVLRMVFAIGRTIDQLDQCVERNHPADAGNLRNRESMRCRCHPGSA